MNETLPTITSIEGFSNERLEKVNQLQALIFARPNITREEIQERLYPEDGEFPWKQEGRLTRDLFALKKFHKDQKTGTELIRIAISNRDSSYAFSQEANLQVEKIVQEAQRIAEITSQFDINELSMPRFQVGDCAYATHDHGMAKYIVFGVAPILTRDSTAKGIFKQWRYLTALHPDYCKYDGDYKCNGFFETLDRTPIDENGRGNPDSWWHDDDGLFHTREELIEWIKVQNY